MYNLSIKTTFGIKTYTLKYRSSLEENEILFKRYHCPVNNIGGNVFWGYQCWSCV